MNRTGIFLRRGLWSALSLFIMATFILGALVLYLELQLPNAKTLDQVQLQQPMRIYSADGKLIAQFGAERRTPISYAKIPEQLINAVLATEDARFFEHSGIDVVGLGRAAVQLIITGSKQQGGSTITMQVARNFFLSPEKTFIRKIKEILLAINIDQHFSKKEILELYLNKIYFGNRAYGIAAAARVYYGTTLDKLSLPQMALLAGLPKAPSTINPLANKQAAIQRRNHVLVRMYELKYINEADYREALATDDDARYHGLEVQLYAPYVAEMVRATLLAQYGDVAYTQGYKVFTTIDSRLQAAANHALDKALLAYDQRHGYRGPEDSWGTVRPELQMAWQTNLEALPMIHGLRPAVVLEVATKSVVALLADGQTITIPWPGLVWAKPERNAKYPGAAPHSAGDVLKVGDVIRVQATTSDEQLQWRLAQIPEIEGALVSLDPQNGAVEALVGGFSYYASNFNRVLQAERQPGSSFKPFIYSAALANGFTLASIINDAPIVINDPSQQGLWRPQNDKRQFNGPTRLKEGLIHSLNLVSIRLLNAMGIQKAIDYLQNFGFDPKKLPVGLSLALGTASVTPLEHARAYAILANGGYKIAPFIISQIIDGKGELIFKVQPQVAYNPNNDTSVPNELIASQVISPQIAYLMNSALQDVIKRGTAGKALVLHRPDLAGKTGTTNDKVDAWFAGFTPTIAAVAWMGFDKPRTTYEYGVEAALPMWINYMQTALQYKPVQLLPEPAGIVTVRIDPQSGLLAAPNQANAIFENFIEGTEPKAQASEQQSLVTSATTASDYEQIF
jgi:penicillin-binding protein 1A